MVGEGWAVGIPTGYQPRGRGAWLTGSRVWQNGRTPLRLAAEKGHAVVVGALLAAEADKDATVEVRGGRLQGESGAVRCGLH